MLQLLSVNIEINKDMSFIYFYSFIRYNHVINNHLAQVKHLKIQ